MPTRADLPFLYVCARPQQDAAAAERRSFRDGLGLSDARLDTLDLVRQPVPADVSERYAGFVVGGSPFNVTDPESTKTDPQRHVEAGLELLARAALDSSLRAFFTCYGIGVVSRLLGAEVSRAFPEDTGPTSVVLTDDAEDDPVFAGLPRRFTALTAHKEGSAEVPAGATLLAGNDACPVQAYRIGDHVWATQFHPEPTAEAFVDRMTVYRNDGYFDSEHFTLIADRVHAAGVREPVRLLRAFAAAD